MIGAERQLVSRTEVTSIACSRDGRLAVVASGIYNTPLELSVWDLARYEPVYQLPSPGVMRHIAWSNDSNTFITGRGVLWHGGQGSPGPAFFVWDASTGKLLHQFGSDLYGVRGVTASVIIPKTPIENSPPCD